MMIDVGPTLSQDLRDQKIAVAFLALHGPGGEDGSIQGFLETLGIPYTGSGIQASAVGMHKVTTKTVLTAHGIPVPAGMVIKRGEKVSSAQVLRTAKLRWPVVVKPASARVHDRRHNCEEACSVERGVGAGPSIRS